MLNFITGWHQQKEDAITVPLLRYRGTTCVIKTRVNQWWDTKYYRNYLVRARSVVILKSEFFIVR